MSDKTLTMCCIPEYIAPESILHIGYDMSVDWWALVVLVFEMVVGYPPFQDRNMFDLYDKILEGKVEWPRGIEIDSEVKDFVSQLLVRDMSARLGKGEVEEVKRHSWLVQLSWSDVVAGKLQPPLVPQLSHAGDHDHYQEYPEECWWEVEEVKQGEREVFKGF